LEHEILDDAMKGQAIVVWPFFFFSGGGLGELPGAVGETEENGHGLRGLVGKQLDLDITHAGADDGDRIGGGRGRAGGRLGWRICGQALQAAGGDGNQGLEWIHGNSLSFLVDGVI
jgi:hypothetical protein